MLFRSSAHLLFWAFGIVTVAVLGVLAIHTGYFDLVFKTATQSVLAEWEHELEKAYGINGESIDRAIKAIGMAFTILFGGLAFLKGWHYAEMNLPTRLVEFNERIRAANLHDRGTVLAPYACRNLRGDRLEAPQKTWLQRIASMFRTNDEVRLQQNLMRSVETLDGDLKVLNAELDRYKAERVSAHLIVGLRLHASAQAMTEDSSAQHAQHEAALAELKKAILVNGNDVDALEQAARIANVLNLSDATDTYLEQMESTSQNQKKLARRARALRFQAEILERSSKDKDLNEARIKLEAARNALTQHIGTLDAQEQQRGANGEVLEKFLELALTNEQLGRLQLRRGKYTRVRSPLDDAETFYKKLKSVEGAAGEKRIEALRAQLKRAESGEDEPDQIDGSSESVPLDPTHVNLEELSVRGEAGDSAEVVRVLPAVTSVTLLKSEDDWALIAKNGERLGYVPEKNLTKLN
jgi:hypothetical protein